MCITERYTEIERENRILLEKMSNIMQNPKPNLYSMGMGGVSTYGPGSFGAGFTAGPGVKKSLNREKRRRELVKITQENQAFLKRLQ